MLNKLNELINSDFLKTAIKEQDFFFEVKIGEPPFTLRSHHHWNSLIVNKRKPYTYRIFMLYEGYRVCLHRFDPCDTHEAFQHPHPWPAAFKILKGGYRMDLGQSINNVDGPLNMNQLMLMEGSSYEIIHPFTWHRITPLTETYTIMVNGPEFPDNVKHCACRTTKGKDLLSLTTQEVEDQLKVFRVLLYGDSNV